ncbi:DNA polymerase I [Bombilactobacillus mellis]|uniref:DNA polymerase I n=1 Tax=Bombilactobacillus mellis TaxID=1218508 RepID=UPI0022479894|nr:DNA polymerase I [Bombilactobacillus mellis]MCX0279285.1 DNA polymerase I [Bombilactobacillus mellis]
MEPKKLILVDGNSIAFRAFYAMYAVLEKFKNPEGLHTNAIYAFNNMLDLILSKGQPTDMLVAFDAGKYTFRNQLYDDYKGNRLKTPTEFQEQMPFIKQLLKARGIKTYELENYEADDIIGTVAQKAQKKNFQTTIVTGDRDLTQLVNEQTTVALTIKGVTELEFYTPQHFQEKLGIKPAQLIDVKALMGDTSDNYPGVTKVGEKTALKLIKQYGSLDQLYAQIDKMKASKLKEHLLQDRDVAFLSQKLATIQLDVPVQLDIDQLTYEGDQINQLRDFYQKMNFRTFLSKMGTETTASTIESVETNINFQELSENNVKEITVSQQAATVLVEMVQDNYHKAPIIGFGVGIKDQIWVTDNAEILHNPQLKSWLQNPQIKKAVFDFKRNYVALNRWQIHLAGVDFDALLASYLIDVNENSNDLGKLAQGYDYQDLMADSQFYGRGAKLTIPPRSELLQHLAAKITAINFLKTKLPQKLQDHDQDQLFDEIELPLSQVLADMEIAGIKVDRHNLEQMQQDLDQRLQDLEADIYQQAGHEFNINSPQQLSKVLFEELGLKPIKKNKRGYSTSVDVLEKLRGQAPIIAQILDYRQVAKIQSTYVIGLMNSIAADEKVHTRYQQTLTQTGRLSSVDPNLQNIPARDEGREIRKAFVPSHAGWEIFSSDYSQIELRVLAHISGDQNMQKAFADNYDIHAHTAMRIFGLHDISEVTPDMRRQAKATNFGIVYGISDYGLSQNIGISRKRAAEFINAYFEQYPDVKNYMDKIVQMARTDGYVETIMHRRRYLPDIHSRNYHLRSFAERTAMNTPIQGSAADIIKIAMINMQKKLRADNLQATMLLQVHDELIFEAPKTEIPILEKLVPQIMDSAVQLDVPLKVESAHGPTWFDAKG